MGAGAGIEAVVKPYCEPMRFVREIRDGTGELGTKVGVDAFAEVAAVDVTATSKGRGFSGAMKRQIFSGERATHGVM